MSWSATGSALKVTNGLGTTTDYNVTSTATVLMSEGGQSWLRMYGVVFADLQATGGGTPFTNAAVACTPISPWTARYPSANVPNVDYHQFIDSQTWTTTGSFTSPILVDKRYDYVYSTCVWYHLSSDNFQVTWERLLDTNGTTDRVTTAAGTARVVYKDIDVIELPNNMGWLMVLARYIVDINAMSIDQSNSIAQIVAWWSQTPDFAGDQIYGPFLLVDSLNAWSKDQTVRLWLGVPGVEFVKEDDGDYQIYVYYVVEECGLGYSGLGTAGLGSYLRDTLTRAEYEAGLRAMNFQAGVAVKRIELNDLAKMVNTEWLNYRFFTPGVFTYTDEATWPGTSLVGGELLGGVRLWFFDGPLLPTLAYPVRSFFDDYPSLQVQLVDPAPARCGLDIEDHSLYFAVVRNGATATIAPFPATSTALGSGHGLWRARAMPDGQLLNYGGMSIITTAGKDFALANQVAMTNISPDQIVEGVSATVADIDPDPVWTRSGWWVASGNNTLLSAFEGRRWDGCGTWEDALYGGTTPFSYDAPVFGGGVTVPGPTPFA